MDKAERKKAIKQLLELIAENPEVADRITITIKPAQLDDKPSEKPK